MDKHCNHNIPETKKGIGPCDIRYEVKKRNGKPNWWCRTHGLEASDPSGQPLPACSGAWFEPVPRHAQRDICLGEGEVALWGVVPPGIAIGDIPTEPGKVHVHFRESAGSKKLIDSSFEIVRLQNGTAEAVVESMAAQALAVSRLTSQEMVPLPCPHCREIHIDEQKFATQPHRKHQCNSCGRNFWDKVPSISNPLANLQRDLGLPPPPPPQRVHRPLNIRSSDFAAVAMWPSNSAIVSTMSRPEDVGIHVHAWVDGDGGPHLHLDETYSPVVLDGQIVDECALRMLAVQRMLAKETHVPIVALDCASCGHSLLSPTTGWIEPVTRHRCGSCGAENRTRLKSFVNPLAAIGAC
ncbi:hypothetical protein [Candidatus Poriferisodalis sp.]|uniref:hypothetical protein n=1 Tax=Candidatus Poriferisodalis sp. TaxID=3101277 RepID=UPI003B0265DA